MKKETTEAKLNALFGLTEKVQEVKAKSTGRVVGVTEEEIQEFREIQGLIYFLQAPELFSEKTCKHCGSKFLVSRKYVAYCSYTCISKSLYELTGVTWHKGKDIEELVMDRQVYNGQEPIWIRQPSLTRAQAILNRLLADQPNKEDTGESSPVPTSPSDRSLDSEKSEATFTSSVGSTITPPTSSEPTNAPSKKSTPKRVISFDT